jgi:hypothetical protein
MVGCPIITQRSQAADYSSRGDSKQFGSPRPSWFYTGFEKASRESLSFNFFSFCPHKIHIREKAKLIFQNSDSNQLSLTSL